MNRPLTMTAILSTETEKVCANTVQVSGRDAWALSQLIKAGDRGCTPIDNPAPRWSAYVFNLRKAGFAIETLHEAHSGQFPGTHARYVLRSDITVSENR